MLLEIEAKKYVFPAQMFQQLPLLGEPWVWESPAKLDSSLTYLHAIKHFPPESLQGPNTAIIHGEPLSGAVRWDPL